MRNLEAFAARDDFRQFRADIREYSIVQGIVLDYHPFWRRLWQLYQRTGMDPQPPYSWWRDTPLFTPQQRYNLDWIPSAWKDFLGRLGKSGKTSPIYVILSIRPPGGDPESRDAALAQRQRLLSLIVKYPFIVELEDRPRASLFSGAAAVAGSASALKGGFAVSGGTVGGVLRDVTSGDHFALTCGHVVSSGSTYSFTDNKGSVCTPQGTCAASHHLPPTVNPAGVQCNPGVTGCVANQYDLAFLRLSTKVAATEVDGVGQINGMAKKSDLTPKQSIEMSGQGTSHHGFEVGGLTVAYELDWGGNKYCFENLFEVRGVPTPGLAAPIQRGLLTVPQPKDSGAWICLPTSAGHDFAGMLIGGDLLMGYAMFTDIITATARGGGRGLDLVWV